MRKFLIVIIALLGLAWILPSMYNLATSSYSSSPMSLYSALTHKYYTMTFNDGEVERKDREGNIYTQEQFDSLLPMVYARQLIYRQEMPKKINGITVDINKIRISNLSYRYRPYYKNTPSIKLYPLIESVPERLDLVEPSDRFRFVNSIEFIDMESNTINTKKSKRYNDKFIRHGFKGPVKFISGIPSTRKNYDEGYFIMDSNNHLFHMKQVCNTPFITRVRTCDKYDIEYFTATDFTDKQAYGFFFTKDGQMYRLLTDMYKVEKIDLPKVDLDNDQLSIMGNYMIWNCTLIHNNEKSCYAIDVNKMKQVDSIRHKEEMCSNFFDSIIPFEISFIHSNTRYLELRITNNFPYSLIFNLIFVLIFVFLERFRIKGTKSILNTLLILATGLYGFIVYIFLLREKK